MSKSLGEALPEEIARVRDEILPVYTAIGMPGAFAATCIRADLDEASRAMIEGDLDRMIGIYQRLKEWET